MSEEITTLAAEEDVKPAPLKKLPDLKAIREGHGVTIEDIFLRTRISIPILNAIENGDFHLLPAPVYARNFIQIYAEAIGIDAGIILAHYQRHVDKMQAVPEEVRIVKVQIASDRKPFKHYLLYAAPAVAIIAIALIMYAFFYEKTAPDNAHRSVTVDQPKQAVPNSSPALKERPQETAADPPQAPPSMAVGKETTQAPDNARLDLLIEATEETWLKITEDGNPPYQLTLKKGDKLSRKAREFFIIDVGNAAGVNITFLGKSLGNLGRKGQVVHLRLPQQ